MPAYPPDYDPEIEPSPIPGQENRPYAPPYYQPQGMYSPYDPRAYVPVLSQEGPQVEIPTQQRPDLVPLNPSGNQFVPHLWWPPQFPVPPDPSTTPYSLPPYRQPQPWPERSELAQRQPQQQQHPAQHIIDWSQWLSQLYYPPPVDAGGGFTLAAMPNVSAILGSPQRAT